MNRLATAVVMVVASLAMLPTSAVALEQAGAVSTAQAANRAPDRSSTGAKRSALRLSVSSSRVTAGTRVTFTVLNLSGSRRIVRLQAWDPARRAWRTKSTSTVRHADRIALTSRPGTTRYRAMARKQGSRPTLKSATVSVTGRPAPRSVRPPTKPVTTPTTAPTTSPTKAQPTTAPTTTPPDDGPTTPPPARDGTGSLPIGDADYPVPANAVFVAPHGTATGTGTDVDPYGSLAYAMSKSRAGQTVVLRGGRYHESVVVPAGRDGLVIQNQPGEAVWLDGTIAVTSWVPFGNRWVAPDWTHAFDGRVLSGKTDQTTRYVDASRPMASFPDQVWIDGRMLTQVGSATEVRPGTFFVDAAAQRLEIGDDPRGKRVEASTLQKAALEIQATGAVIRGIGVRGYATTTNQYGAIIAAADRVRMENVVVADNAWVGIAAWRPGQEYRHVTVSGNGIMGLGGNNSSNLLVADSLVSGNNAQGFKPAPVAAGIKITRAKDVVLRDNIVTGTRFAGGIWFDVSSSYLTIVGNTVSHNTAGIMVELSANALVADNQIFGDVGTGLRIQASGSVDVWNNTIDDPRPFAVWADARRQEVPALVETIPWIVEDIEVHNNVLRMTGANSCPVLTQDESQQLVGNDFGITTNNNLFVRTNVGSPANVACWADGARQVKSFKNLQQYRTATGNAADSTLWEGPTPIQTVGSLQADAQARASSVAAPLPATVASAIGEPTGTKHLGAFSERR